MFSRTYFYFDQSPALYGVLLYVCPYSNQSIPKRLFFSFCTFSNQIPAKRFFPLILTEALPKRVFSLFCPNPNQSPVTKGVFLCFCPYQTPPKKDVLSSFTLFYRKPHKKDVFLYFCSNTNQRPTTFFFLFLPLFYPKSYQKRFFLKSILPLF